MSKFPNTLLVRQGFPAKTAQEFIAHEGQSGQGELRLAGGRHHLASRPPSCSHAGRRKLVHVPYRGTGPALNDIVAGHVDLIFMELSAAP